MTVIEGNLECSSARTSIRSILIFIEEVEKLNNTRFISDTVIP
jgi:hypothetical protein